MFKEPLVEVDEKADLLASDTEVGQKLSFEDGIQATHALDLDDDGVLDEEVDSVLADGSTLGERWYRDLAPLA